MEKKGGAAVKAEEIFECAFEMDGNINAEASLILSGDSLSIRRGDDKPILLTTRQVVSLGIGDTDIKINTSSTKFRIFKLGRRFDKASELVSSWFKRGKLSDSIMHEKPLEVFEEVEYDLSRKGKRAGSVKLYCTHASIADSRNGKIKRLSYSYVRDILDEGLALNIRMLKGPDVSLSMLGRRKDFLIRRMRELILSLSGEVGKMAGTLLGLESESDIKELASLMPDGRAVLLDNLEKKAPKLAQAFMKLSSSTRLSPLTKAADELAFGLKKGLVGELDGDYIWVLAKIGDTVVFDTVSEITEAARAAYLFKLEGSGFAGFTEELSWCLTNISFRREPIYLSEEKLKEPGNENYLHALEDVPELVRIRSLFKSRVAHSEDGSWVEKVLKGAQADPMRGR
jgi:hypothetical protein